MKRFGLIFLCMLLICPTISQADELCTDGFLLFREDFGGNDPSDPMYYKGKAPGMSSSYTNTEGLSMSSGCYVITKKGYRNGIQWHLQDDHTYFGDYTRGYFLEVDGKGDNATFFSTEIDGLCEGLSLSFTAYVVNVVYAGQIPYLQKNFGYAYPRMRFQIEDVATGRELASYSTGDIQADESKVWDINLSESADWQLVGMNFTVPEGVERVKLSISNNVTSSGVGNDFALDDIEIRLCMPPIHIQGEDSVCRYQPAQLTSYTDFPYMIYEQLYYKWWHSTDSVEWTEIQTSTSKDLDLSAVQAADSGWYRVAMSTAERIDSENCRTISEPFQLSLKSPIQCIPPAYIVSPHNVCEGRHYRFNVLFENNGGIVDPIVYRWYYAKEIDPDLSPEENTWTILQEGSTPDLEFDNIQAADSGWYRIAIANIASIDDTLGRAVSDPFHLRVNEECPVCTDGRLLVHDDLGNTPAASYSRSLDVCTGTELSILANVSNSLLPDQARLTVIILDQATQTELKRYVADETELDEWRRAGFNFGVPTGGTQIEVQIANETGVRMDNMAIYLCSPGLEITSADTVCREDGYLFTSEVRNGVNDRLAFMEPLEYQWYYTPDMTQAWQPITEGNTADLRIDRTWDTDSGWYKVTAAEQGNIGNPNCRAESEPFRLNIKKCFRGSVPKDTTICDTLILFDPYVWRGVTWEHVGDSSVMLHYAVTNEDSVLMMYHLDTFKCCPDIHNEPVPLTGICDTLLPYTWYFRDTAFVFADISDIHYFSTPHPRWTCTDSVYILTIDTVHCEKKWPFVVNKYNHVLLLDYTAFGRLLPGRTAQAFQWYKNAEQVIGATDDDYSEQGELQGVFQLRVLLDGDEYVWSNIIELGETPEPQPVQKRIYDSRGRWVNEDQVQHGLYLIIYQQGERIWAEKRILL